MIVLYRGRGLGRAGGWPVVARTAEPRRGGRSWFSDRLTIFDHLDDALSARRVSLIIYMPIIFLS
jgi:hypothetical protein